MVKEYNNPLFADSISELFDDTSIAMQLAYGGMIETGHSYLIRSYLLLKDHEVLAKANYRAVLERYEKRWKIWRQ